MSAAERLRLKPCLPVAQNAQSMAQPTWLEMHRVPRAGSGMKTVSMAWPPSIDSIHLRVPSPASCRERISGVRISAISARRARSALEISVIVEKSALPKRYIQVMSCRARNGFSPRSANNASSPSRDRPNRLMRASLMLRSAGPRADLGAGEEEGDLVACRVGAIRAMHDGLLDAVCEICANRARIGFRRVGGAHDLAVPGDGVIAFEHADHDGAGRHVAHQVLVERPLAMHGIKGTRLGRRKMPHPRGDHLEVPRLEATVDLAEQVLLDAVGLDDGKRAFDRHGVPLDSQSGFWSKCVTKRHPATARCAPPPRGAQRIILLPRDPGVQSDAEALAATAFALGVRVAETERLVETLLDEVEFRPIDQAQMLWRHEHAYLAVLENNVLARHFICIINNIRPARAPGALHAQANAGAAATARQVILYACSRRFGQGNGHCAIAPRRSSAWRLAATALFMVSAGRRRFPRDAGAESIFHDQQVAQFVCRRLERRRQRPRVQPVEFAQRSPLGVFCDPRGRRDHVGAPVGPEAALEDAVVADPRLEFHAYPFPRFAGPAGEPFVGLCQHPPMARCRLETMTHLARVVQYPCIHPHIASRPSSPPCGASPRNRSICSRMTRIA